ncbi:MAG: hypothetical protein ACIAQU_08630 [Phycisphaerales bacterium JB064]
MSAALGVWALACAVAFGALWTYANTPGERGALAAGWTPPAELDVPGDRPVLILFAHPKCPCTRATMSELERLQRSHPGAFAVRVIFFEPVDATESWRETDLWQRAQRLRNALVVADPDGRLCAGAGAEVSGCVALLDPSGGVQFWGGITAARGHEGENLGLIALRDILDGQEPRQRTADVFGCGIGGAVPATQCADEGACDADS